MACEDHHGHSLFITFKTIVVSVCYLETIKSDGMWRLSWSSTFITFEASRFWLTYLMLPMLFLLIGFLDWASGQSGGGIARTKLVSYLYFPFIANKRYVKRGKYHTLISSGDDCLLIFGFLSAELSCLTLIAMQFEGFCDVSKEMRKILKMGAKWSI